MPPKSKAKQQYRKTRKAYAWLLPITGLFVLGCVAYWNSSDAPFVFDDLETIQRNGDVRLGIQFSPSQLLHTRSLLHLTFIFNNWLGGQNVLGYHIVNLVLHLLNGILIFAIALRIFRRISAEETTARTYAFCAAAFFLVHPVQTESVTYVSSRSELLSTFFYLLGFGCFLVTPESSIGFLTGIAVLACLALGFGGKETVVTLPAAILLYDYLFVAKGEFPAILKRWRFYLSFVVVAAAASYYLLADQVAKLVGQDYGPNFAPWPYFLTEQRVIVTYMRLIFLPTGLHLDYDFQPSASIREPAVLLALLFITSVILAGWKLRRTNPVFTFSILWFFITLSPTSSIIPIQDVIFEHRLYLPLAGVCLSFPFVVDWLIRIATKKSTTKAVAGLAGFVLVLLTIATVLRNEVWRDEIRFFSDVVAKSPHKYRAYNDLMFAGTKNGQERQSISVARTALQEFPERRLFLLDTIGNLYLRLGQPADAVTSFKSSIDEARRLGLTPKNIPGTANNLAVAYLALSKTFQSSGGQMTEEEAGARRTQALRDAREWFQWAVEGDPANIAVLDSLVNVRRALGEASVLERELTRKLEMNPHEFGSLYALAALLSLEDRYVESLNYFQQAEEIKNSSEVVHFNYAYALSKAGQSDRAVEQYLKAIRIDPIFSEAHYNLALLYIQKTDYDSAVGQLNDILSWEANNLRANMKLAEIYAYKGNLVLARQHLQKVLQTDPRNAPALSLSQKIGVQQ
jgi:tetratricopeptide (TPR) repeat protein